MKPFHLVEDEAKQELEGTSHKILEISSFQFKMSMIFCLPRNFQFSQNNLAKAFTKLAKNIIFLSKKYICNDQSKLKIAMFQLLMFSFSYRYENDKDLVQILDFLVFFFCIDLIYVIHKALLEIKKIRKLHLWKVKSNFNSSKVMQNLWKIKMVSETFYHFISFLLFHITTYKQTSFRHPIFW